MSDAAEEARAAAWRAQQARRAQAEAARVKALRGSPEAAQRVYDSWSPLINRQQER